jgi:hypothetical protein
VSFPDTWQLRDFGAFIEQDRPGRHLFGRGHKKVYFYISPFSRFNYDTTTYKKAVFGAVNVKVFL